MNVNYSPSSSVAVFFEEFLPVLSPSLKKIGAIAAIAFGILAACYVIKRYFFKNSHRKISFSPPLTPKHVRNGVHHLMYVGDIPEILAFLSKHGNKLKELHLQSILFSDKNQSVSRNQFLKDILMLCPNLKYLKIDFDITDADLNDFRTMHSLKHLQITKQTNDQFLNFLVLCPNLKSLYLDGDFTDNDLKHIVKHIGIIKTFKNLDIAYNSSLTDIGIAQLEEFDLESLALTNCDKIDGSGFAKQRVNSLKLHGCQNISDNSLCYMTNIYLRMLELSYCPITDVGLSHLKAPLNLKLESGQLMNGVITLNKLEDLSKNRISTEVYWKY